MHYYLIFIIGIVFTLFFIIGTHELGHFLVARACGVHVLRFSIGFGQRLFSWRDKRGTQYALSLIPLGGYIQMLDEHSSQAANFPISQHYNHQPFYRKFCIIAAGPLSNFLCAIIIYWLVYSLGFHTLKPIIGTVMPNSLAAQAKLPANSEIIALDGYLQSDWSSIAMRLLSHASESNKVAIETRSLDSQRSSMHYLNLANWHFDPTVSDPLHSLGIIPYFPKIPLEIGRITANSAAAEAKLQIGDVILAIDEQRLSDWQGLSQYLATTKRTHFILKIKRAQQVIEVPVQLNQSRQWLNNKPVLGIGSNYQLPAHLIKTIQYSPWPAAIKSIHKTGELIYFNFVMIAKLISGKLSLKGLSGPITLFQSAGNALNAGYLVFLNFLAFLSISIGFINLLPIPGLDGGHLLLQAIEGIYRKPLPSAAINFAYRIGFAFLIFIFMQSIANDITRLVS
jgi:regulator of sigma E protease